MIDHWQDVTVGSIVGLVVSYFSYRQYYPPLHSAYSHLPFSPRIHMHDDVQPTGAGIPRSSLEHLAPGGDTVYRDGDLEAGPLEHHVEQHELAGTVGRGQAGQGTVPLDQIWKGQGR